MTYTETRTLSVRKDREKIHAVDPIYLRQGDCGMQIQVTVVDGGSPFDLTDATVTLEANVKSGHYLSESIEKKDIDTENSIITYTVSGALTEAKGRAQICYFQIVIGDDIFTTDAIPVIVLAGADATADVAQQWERNAQAIIDRLNELLKNAEDETGNLSDPNVTQTPATDSTAYPILTQFTPTTVEVIQGTKFATGVTITASTKTITAEIFQGKATESAHAETADSAETANTAKTADTAETADALTCESVGNASTPVYFADGVPQVCESITAGSEYPIVGELDVTDAIDYVGEGLQLWKYLTYEGATINYARLSENFATVHLEIKVNVKEAASGGSAEYAQIFLLNDEFLFPPSGIIYTTLNSDNSSIYSGHDIYPALGIHIMLNDNCITSRIEEENEIKLTPETDCILAFDYNFIGEWEL